MLHGKGKSSSFVDYSVSPNSAAMTLDYQVGDGQTHASSLGTHQYHAFSGKHQKDYPHIAYQSQHHCL